MAKIEYTCEWCMGAKGAPRRIRCKVCNKLFCKYHINDHECIVPPPTAKKYTTLDQYKKMRRKYRQNHTKMKRQFIENQKKYISQKKIGDFIENGKDKAD